MKKYLLLLALAPGVIGCVVAPETVSSAGLCYRTAHWGPQGRTAAQAELDRRGYRCTPADYAYGSGGRIDPIELGTAASLMRGAPPPTTQTYIINGRAVTCTTTGAHTVCN